VLGISYHTLQAYLKVPAPSSIEDTIWSDQMDARVEQMEPAGGDESVAAVVALESS